jgi:thiopeptide-type bacteriocin biosynthesis protein
MNAPDTTWLAGHLYYAGAPETFLTQAVAPFVHTVLAYGWARQCFFIRYGERGPHIRLRFQGDAPTLLQRVKPQLTLFFQQYFARYPSQRDEPAWVQEVPAEEQWFPNNSVQFITYEPEIERYGGPEGIRIAEQQFHASSRAVLALLQDSAHWSYDRALGAAIQLHLTFAAGLGMDWHEAVRFFTSVAQHWCHHPAVLTPQQSPEAQARQWEQLWRTFAQHFRQQQATLVPYHQTLWQALMEDVTFEHDWLNHWRHAMQQVGCALRRAQDQQQLRVPDDRPLDTGSARPTAQQALWPIFESYVHMTNNRLGIRNRDEAYLAYLMQQSLHELSAA